MKLFLGFLLIGLIVAAPSDDKTSENADPAKNDDKAGIPDPKDKDGDDPKSTTTTVAPAPQPDPTTTTAAPAPQPGPATTTTTAAPASTTAAPSSASVEKAVGGLAVLSAMVLFLR